MSEQPTEVADGVWRLGTDLVNFYLVVDGTQLTLVDAALKGYRPSLEQALGSMGRRLADIDAVVLTHAHPDHVGLAETVRSEAGAPVYVHPGDGEMATTGDQTGGEVNLVRYLHHAAAWKLLWAFVRDGSIRPPTISVVHDLSDGETLDVPGRPTVVATPGHSPGHVCLHLEDRGVLFTGDALVEYNPLLGTRGPQLPPAAFTADVAQATNSLSRIEPLDADLLLFGHGDPWANGPAEAVARAREIGPT